MIIVKLGGSVVTDKSSRETLDEKRLRAVAAALGEYDGDLVVVHGGGSFGHPAAAEREVSATEGTRSAGDAVAVHDAMGRLNSAVVDALAGAGLTALPVRPLSFVHRDRNGDVVVPADGIAAMVSEGFVPVLHGDVVVHAGKGVTVASGDALLTALARSLPVDRVGVCSREPGVLDADGAVISRIDRFEDVVEAVGDSDETDVTGGMAAKVRTLLDLRARAHVFGPDALGSFLAGDAPGTEIRGEPGE